MKRDEIGLILRGLAPRIINFKDFFINPDGICFVSFAAHKRVDEFTGNEYKNMLVEYLQNDIDLICRLTIFD